MLSRRELQNLCMVSKANYPDGPRCNSKSLLLRDWLAKKGLLPSDSQEKTQENEDPQERSENLQSLRDYVASFEGKGNSLSLLSKRVVDTELDSRKGTERIVKYLSNLTALELRDVCTDVPAFCSNELFEAVYRAVYPDLHRVFTGPFTLSLQQFYHDHRPEGRGFKGYTDKRDTNKRAEMLSWEFLYGETDAIQGDEEASQVISDFLNGEGPNLNTLGLKDYPYLTLTLGTSSRMFRQDLNMSQSLYSKYINATIALHDEILRDLSEIKYEFNPHGELTPDVTSDKMKTYLSLSDSIPEADDSEILRMVVRKGQSDSLKIILNDRRSDPNALGGSSLILAALFSHLKTIKLLLDDDRIGPSIETYKASSFALNLSSYDLYDYMKALDSYITKNDLIDTYNARMGNQDDEPISLLRKAVVEYDNDLLEMLIELKTIGNRQEDLTHIPSYIIKEWLTAWYGYEWYEKNYEHGELKGVHYEQELLLLAADIDNIDGVRILLTIDPKIDGFSPETLLDLYEKRSPTYITFEAIETAIREGRSDTAIELALMVHQRTMEIPEFKEILKSYPQDDSFLLADENDEYGIGELEKVLRGDELGRVLRGDELGRVLYGGELSSMNDFRETEWHPEGPITTCQLAPLLIIAAEMKDFKFATSLLTFESWSEKKLLFRYTSFISVLTRVVSKYDRDTVSFFLEAVKSKDEDVIEILSLNNLMT